MTCWRNRIKRYNGLRDAMIEEGYQNEHDDRVVAYNTICQMIEACNKMNETEEATDLGPYIRTAVRRQLNKNEDMVREIIKRFQK